MSKIILLYGYNKYNNRIVKYLPSFNDYQALITPPDANTPAAYQGLIRDNINFDYQDGVHAHLILNVFKKDPAILKLDEPDYVVLLENDIKEGENAVTKLSRWYVLDASRTRGGQYHLSLRRDLLADNYETVLNTPVFVERGNPDIDDPIVFNRESFTYNQIKKKELLLDFNKLSGKGRGWIVGYIAREETPTDIGPCKGHAKLPLQVLNWSDIPASVQALITAGTCYYQKPNSCFITLPSAVNNRDNGEAYDYKYYQIWDNAAGGITSNYFNYRNGGSDYIPPSPNDNPYLYFKYTNSDLADGFTLGEVCNYLAQQYSLYNSNFGVKVQTWYDSLNLSARFTDKSIINRYNDIVFQKDGKYYKLVIRRNGTTSTDLEITKSQLSSSSGSAPAITVALANMINNHILNYSPKRVEILETSEANKIAAYVGMQEEVWEFAAIESEFDEIETTLTATRNEVLDAPYDMFCIPIGPVKVLNNGTEVLTNTDNVALAIARGISVKGGSKIYDIQVLPYCPFAEILTSDGNIDIYGYTEGKDYSYITKTIIGNTYNCGIVLYAKSCKGTFDMDIPTNSEVYPLCLEETSDIKIKKQRAETELVRFVSPNFSSTFEINVQKNKGIVNLNVDYFYKPYSPYIHVAPYFSGLYGSDFDDPKGLICSGDFSIATTSSKWEEYQIQNKNYELIFNRQVQNLDVNNAIAYEQLKTTGEIGKWTVALQGAAAGAVTGATVGSAAGPWGTAIGAVGGAVVGGATSYFASDYGAKKDLEYLAKSQQEARSYMIDMYTYNLGNIQALPYSLTRVSAFTQNNKIFPFIEFYDCTSEEKQALNDKIFYNGMTIMRIGKIADYIQDELKYVQGQLIRLVGIYDSNHVIAEIANEIKQGAYYYGTNSE